MSVILGIDPGSRVTGYGIIEINNNKIFYLNSGYINLKEKNFFFRLKKIYYEISVIINKFNPNLSSIEKIFIGKNKESSLKLCQAKNAAIMSLLNYNIPIFEYTSKQVKKYVLNTNSADKVYVKNFIRKIFTLNNNINHNEADALTIAMTHFYFIKNKFI